MNGLYHAKPRRTGLFWSEEISIHKRISGAGVFAMRFFLAGLIITTLITNGASLTKAKGSSMLMDINH
jgi:hypothetical protein